MNEVLFSEEQKKIIDNEIYPIYFRGCAGSGKTDIILEKIMRLIENGIDLSNIAVLLFSPNDADFLKEKLRSKINEKLKNIFSESLKFQLKIIDDSPICTIYEFSKKIIRQLGMELNISYPYDVKTFQTEMKNIIDAEISAYPENKTISQIPPYALRKTIYEFIKYCYDNYIDPLPNILDNIIIEDNTNFWNEFKIIFIEICRECALKIEEKKQKENVFTRNDLVKTAIRLLKNDSTTKLISDEFKYLFIENFQDSNIFQIHFTKIMIEAGVNVFLSADEQQSIYSFKGADINNFFDICKIHNITETPYLRENHRSDGKLIHEFNKIFSTDFAVNGEKIDFPFQEFQIPPQKNGTGLINCLKIVYEKNICSILKDVMKNEINGNKIQFGDIAIICRRSYDINTIADQLGKSEIPYEIVSKKNYYSSGEIIDTLKIFNAIINKEKIYKKELKSTIYYKCFTINKTDDEFWVFFLELEGIFRFASFAEALNYLFEETAIIDYLNTAKNYQAKNNLIKLKETVFEIIEDEKKTPIQIYSHLKSMIKSNKTEKEANISDKDRQNGLVRLFSIHKARGLEFPVVIIPNIDMRVNRKKFTPNFILERNGESYNLAFNAPSLCINRNYDKGYIKMYKSYLKKHIEEELRLFYVASTRTKNMLILSNGKSYNDFLNSFSWEDYISIPKLLETKYSPD